MAAPKRISVNHTTAPDLDTRRDWAATHSIRIAAMLEAPAKKEVPGRVWRARLFMDGDYVVVTLVQNIKTAAPVPGQMTPAVSTFVVRGYHRAGANGAAVTQQNLFGSYSTDEIVAFLRLDLVDPDSVTWKDETHYSDIIVVGDVIAKHGRLH